jgi:hypothetical protein
MVPVIVVAVDPAAEDPVVAVQAVLVEEDPEPPVVEDLPVDVLVVLVVPVAVDPFPAHRLPVMIRARRRNSKKISALLNSVKTTVKTARENLRRSSAARKRVRRTKSVPIRLLFSRSPLRPPNAKSSSTKPYVSPIWLTRGELKLRNLSRPCSVSV